MKNLEKKNFGLYEYCSKKMMDDWIVGDTQINQFALKHTPPFTRATQSVMDTQAYGFPQGPWSTGRGDDDWKVYMLMFTDSQSNLPVSIRFGELCQHLTNRNEIVLYISLCSRRDNA